jgi:hypothetical protein
MATRQEKAVGKLADELIKTATICYSLHRDGRTLKAKPPSLDTCVEPKSHEDTHD